MHMLHRVQEQHACDRCGKEVSSMQMNYRVASPVLEAAGLREDERDWQSWLFAAGAVATRSMHFPGDSVGCLTPFGDMFNFFPPTPPVTPKIPLDSDYMFLQAGSCHKVSEMVSDIAGEPAVLCLMHESSTQKGLVSKNAGHYNIQK
jgi:hypothetical protein